MEEKCGTEQSPFRVNLQYIRGFPFPQHFEEQKILSGLNYSPLDDDIIISSYPKTGTTWVQYIVLQILHKAEFYPNFGDLTLKYFPYMEMTGAEAAERLQSPRFMKFHLPYSLTPRSSSAKYIYTLRNPKDTAVSFYNFTFEMGSQHLTFDQYFDYFLKGEVSYGDYFEHLLSWYDHRDDGNVLLVIYEELCRDVGAQILRIAEFLGESHLKALEEDSSLLERIIENTSFGHMKRNLHVKVPPAGSTVPSNEAYLEERPVNFFRKGAPGDWRNHLSTEQSLLLDEKIRAKLGETELISIWGNTI